MSRKTKETKKLIEIATKILTAIGFPIQELTPRRSERVAMALLATANIDSVSKLSQPKTIDDGIVMKQKPKTEDYEIRIGAMPGNQGVSAHFHF